MNDVLNAIYGRSSVRQYKNDVPKDEDVKEILKAGFHAATGMNKQSLRFLVIENPSDITELSDKVKSDFIKGLGESAKQHPFYDRMAGSEYHIFHRAPALVFVFSSSDVLTPVEDGSLAIGNMMLAAHSLGYGTCFIGFAASLGEDEEFFKKYNVPQDHKYIACITLGVPDGVPEKHPRSEVKILNWVK